MNKHLLAKVYARVELESAVLSASQAQLTTLLFDGVLNALARASLSIQSNDIEAKGAMIAKAVSVIDSGLIQSLEPFADEPLAKQLVSLFHYIIQQLLLANLHNNLEKIEHCRGLLQTIAEAWQLSQVKK
ncbi:flagellar export chaperone FliS [Tatumella sp. TA1]|uniref:flagellar export chaperone FliS n=1 Tax=Rosenbergiella collisarenosi TaxID=1544695 RepID=UPI0008F876E1|nr:flagellar export chaperone FliS [Rosenbergiella collisarenosi]QGX91281.1 flagellar export chaperone FliS [Tatumella sp. TA1]